MEIINSPLIEVTITGKEKANAETQLNSAELLKREQSSAKKIIKYNTVW
jgi:hypothetical protein